MQTSFAAATRNACAAQSRPAALIVALLASAPAFGQFQWVDETAARFPVQSEYSNYVEPCDIDGDTDLDLVWANGGNFNAVGPMQHVRIYINDGLGDFTDESVARINHMGNYRGVALADIDDDGDADMLLASDFNRQPRLFLNNGLGFFTDATAARLPVITLSSTRGQFADIDDDGDLDIYINHGGASNRFGCSLNRIFINTGGGFYVDETLTRHPAGNVCGPMDVIFGDVDNDFDLDVRTGNLNTNQSKLYLNNGAGVFSTVAGMPSDEGCYSYDLGDINGDGNLDMLGANAGPGNADLVLQGSGGTTGASWTNVSGNLVPNPSADDNDSKFFDFDNDGDMDLVIAALFQGHEKLYRNNGSGVFSDFSNRITQISDASLDVVAADFDGNGNYDIVTAQGESGAFQNRIYMNNGLPDTLPPTVVRFREFGNTCDDGPFIVRATIVDHVTSDRGFYDHGVTLEYSIDAGPPASLDMKWVGNSMWRAVLPVPSIGGTIEYAIEAIDQNDNVGTSSSHVFTVRVGDFDGSGDVGFNDLTLLLLNWGCLGCPEDLDGSGDVGFGDLTVLLLRWGPCT